MTLETALLICQTWCDGKYEQEVHWKAREIVDRHARLALLKEVKSRGMSDVDSEISRLERLLEPVTERGDA